MSITIHHVHQLPLVSDEGAPQGGGRSESPQRGDSVTSGRACEVALGNAQTSIPFGSEGEQKRVNQREKRYRVRNEVRRVTTLERLKKCGHTPIEKGGVVVRATQTSSGRRAGYSGLSTCGSVWACPVCSAKISAQRSEDIKQVLETAQRRGYSVAMVTLTVRHHKGHTLKEVWDAVSTGWKSVTTGSGWLADQLKYKIKGWVKAVEVTHGKNGWHVHVHTLLIFKGGELEANLLGARIFKRWQKGLSKKGFTAEVAHGLDVGFAKGGDSAGKLSTYLAKTGDMLAQEAALGQFKEARNGNRTPFQIALSFFDTGDMEDLALWHEWERFSHGRRQLGWSKGLREWAQLEETEKSDDEIASEEIGSSDDDLVLLPGDSWRMVRGRNLEARVLEMAEKLGQGLTVWLDLEGIAWLPAPKREKKSPSLVE